MASMDPSLADDFATETEEHLVAVEQILLAAEWEAPSPERINLLFRSVHSVKGLARVAGARSLEGIAHQAESLLSPIRAGTRGFEAATQALLLEASDAMRNLRLASLDDLGAPPPPGLLAKLKAATDQPLTGAPTEAAAGPWAALHDDRDLLQGLLELLDELLLEIAEALASPQATDLLAEAFATLRYAARHVHLPGLEAAIRQTETARGDTESFAALARIRRSRQALELLLEPPPPVAPPAIEPELALLAAAHGLDPSRLATLPPTLSERLPGAREVVIALSESAPPETLRALAATLAALDPILAETADGRLALLLEQATPDPAPPDFPVSGVMMADGRQRLAVLGPPRTESGMDVKVNVPVEVLDRLFGRVGEFFGTSARLNALVFDPASPDALHRIADHAATKAPELCADVGQLLRHHADLSVIEGDINRLVGLIHDSTLGLRVIPLDILFGRFPRLVRDLAAAQGKSVRLVSTTEGIKVDKGMVELLADPLMHMLRNAIDHGIETTEQREALGKPRVATLSLTARQQGNRIRLEIADDGRGIDLERVRRKAVAQALVAEAESVRMPPEQVARFIFAPGFSTAAEVSETSGRGVGMDVVLVNVTRLGGRIDIETNACVGTRFLLDLPLSAAIVSVVLVETRAQTIAFPERMVAEVAECAADAVQRVNGQRSMVLHDQYLPLFRLAELMGLPEPESVAPEISWPVVVCDDGRQRMGIEVHRLMRRQEMLMRETHPRIAALPGIGGVSLLGTDRVVLVVDPDGLFALAFGTAAARIEAAAP